MNWTEAVVAMECGRAVRRISQAVRRPAGTTSDGTKIYDEGQEPTVLEQAWTADLQNVLVFKGAWSHVLCRPSADDLAAEDWIVVPR